jgi:transposase
MGPYSLDLRQRIVDAYDHREGSIRELAERFAVSPNTVQNYLIRVRATGSLAPCPHGGGVLPKLDKTTEPQIRALEEEKNDRTLTELAKQVERRCHVRVSRWTMGRTLRRMGITRKKSRSERASRTGRTSSKRGHGIGGEHVRSASSG